jgi:alkaline phosphatase D
VRCGAEAEVQVAFADNPGFAGTQLSDAVETGAGEDFAATLRLTGLAPATRYYYRVLINGAAASYVGARDPAGQSFVTAPALGARSSFRMAFGSCARYALDPEQAIWNAVTEARPDLFCWLGDNIYGDSLRPETYAEEYRRQRDVPDLQSLLRGTPHLATWDDHDYGGNDDDRRNPIKADTLAAFNRYWANPAAGTPDIPGVFFRHSHGAVDLFFLDGRYHRDPNAAPDGPGKTMLGTGQLDWLKRELRESRAAFKLLLSGGGWSQARGEGGDAWSSFLHERNALFDFIRDQSITGVVLLSGDTHVGELNCIPWSERGGYDLYDLVSSPLAQPPGRSWLDHRPEARIRQVAFGGPLFGQLDFDFGPSDPVLRFNVVSSDGRRAWDDFTVSASQLTNGVSSWRQAMDPVSLRRHLRLESDLSYYGR